MLDYLIKFSACLLAFYLFYRLFLEKESIHRFKRIYLLVSVLISGLIPIVSFRIAPESNLETILAPLQNTASEITIPLEVESAHPLWTALAIIYFSGVAVMGLRYLNNLRQLFLKVRKNPNIKESGVTKVLLREVVAPHTFLTYIFLNRKKYLSNQIPSEVLIHERTHACERHSIDILVFEFFQVIFWFHPLIHLLKSSAKLNHEFLADSAVIKNGFKHVDYWGTLLRYSQQKYQPGIAHAINYSSIKKRLQVMKKQTSNKSAFIRLLALLPLVCILLYGFSDRVENLPEYNVTTQRIQEGASAEMIKEYNTLAKKYNASPQDHTLIKSSELKRMSYIYQLMTPAQRKSAEPLPKFATPPSPPEAASAPTPSEEGENLELPPPPPPPPAIPPPSPVEFIEQMANQNATFYYNGKSISARKAISLVKQIKDLHIATKASHTDPPTVYISKGKKSVKKTAPNGTEKK